MAKTKPIGVRFHEPTLDKLKGMGYISPQSALSFLEKFWIHNIENIVADNNKPENKKKIEKARNDVFETISTFGQAAVNVKTLDVGVTVNEVLSDSEKTAIKERISVLETELKNPPKTAIIGIRQWTNIRETELTKLKKQLNLK